MNCDMFETLIFEKLENTISESNDKLLLKHLDICSSCQKQYQELNILKNELKLVPKLKTSSEFNEKLRAKLNRITEISDDCRKSESLLAQRTYEEISNNENNFLNKHLESCIRCQNTQKELDYIHTISPQEDLKVSSSFDEKLKQKLALLRKPEIIDINKKRINLFSKISAYVAGVAVIVISFITINNNFKNTKSSIPIMSISNQNVIAIKNDTLNNDDSLQVLKDKRKLLRFDKMMQVSDEE